MAIDIPEEKPTARQQSLKSETRTAVFCKQNKKKTTKKRITCLLVTWQFPPAMGDSYPGQQSILVLLGQQSHMPMREQRFLICYKEMLAIKTTVTSANSWNSCFHQNSGDSGSPCFARIAVHLNLVVQRPVCL